MPHARFWLECTMSIARAEGRINGVIICFTDGKVDASVPRGHTPYGGRPLSGV